MLGTIIYKNNFTADKYVEMATWCNTNNATIEDKGTYYECIAIVTPEVSLDELKIQKLAEVNAWTEGKITGGFTSSCTGYAVKYDSDKDTQLTMQGIAINAEHIAEYYPAGVPVRGYANGDAEKTVQYLNAAQLLQWQADLSNHIGLCKIQGWTKQNEVAQATTKEDLDNIVLE